MPKFIYTIIVLTLLSWLGFYRYISTTEPESLFRIITFLLIAFIALTLTISLPIYFYQHAKVPAFSNLKFLYRRGLKWSAYFSFGIVFLAALWIFDLANIINVALFIILYVLIFTQLRGRR
jgi:hypothetical protein